MGNRWETVETVAAAAASVVSDSVQPHRWKPTRLCCPWDSPGKNTGVGCHCFSTYNLSVYIFGEGGFVAKLRLKLKKVGKTTKSFRYDLNQIPYDYTVEVANRFK